MWRKHAGKIAVASPLMAASASLVAALFDYVTGYGVGDAILVMALVVNAAVAAAGAGWWGASLRGPVLMRATISVAGALTGFVVYVLTYALGGMALAEPVRRFWPR